MYDSGSCFSKLQTTKYIDVQANYEWLSLQILNLNSNWILLHNVSTILLPFYVKVVVCWFLYTFFLDFFFLRVVLNLFIYLFLLCWVLVSVRGLPLVAASGGHSSSRRAGLSLSRPLLLWSTGSRRVGSVVVAHGPSCSVACGIFPDQGSNPRPLHWQADSQPLRHQGSPFLDFKWILFLHLCRMLPKIVMRNVYYPYINFL